MSERSERPLIRLLLSEYDDGSYRYGSIEWPEDKGPAAVEAIGTNRDGKTLAIEHTLIQPFVEEKNDSKRFLTRVSTNREGCLPHSGQKKRTEDSNHFNG
jgi:hypothetical protein